MEKTKNMSRGGSAILEILKGTIFALVISMLLIIVFAVIIRFVNVPDSIIMPVNQVIKGVSLLIACIIALKGSTKGFIKGLIIGTVYAVLSYIVFSVLSSTLSLGITTITDLLFSAVLGAISGLIAVNIKR
ncbi:MAG: TIGR04086 family membrane protein [Clostridiales bacterium]|nr:TIGR04086 family membrane protein [Clostridiales bacterium]